MRAWWVFLLVWAAGCDREKPRAQAQALQPAVSCFADDIGDVHLHWTEMPICAEDRGGCRKLCDQGDGDACFNLAFELQRATRGDAVDSQEVSDLFQQACKRGLAQGCTNWAAGRLFGDESPDLSCLYRVFAKACDARDAFGCSMNARILVEWQRTVFDPWIGYNQLVNACNRLEGPPCRFLALYIERGRFGVHDPERIKALLARACRGGDEDACGKQTAGETMRP